MESADLITSFFSNEMTPEQERQFLLSVAASDSLRLELKSHAMLDKLLQEENEQAAVPPALRRSIFSQAAAVASAGSELTAGSESPGTARKGRSLFRRAGIGAIGVAAGILGFTAGTLVDLDRGLDSGSDPVVEEALPQEFAPQLPDVVHEVEPTSNGAPEETPDRVAAEPSSERPLTSAVSARSQPATTESRSDVVGGQTASDAPGEQDDPALPSSSNPGFELDPIITSSSDSE